MSSILKRHRLLQFLSFIGFFGGMALGAAFDLLIYSNLWSFIVFGIVIGLSTQFLVSKYLPPRCDKCGMELKVIQRNKGGGRGRLKTVYECSRCILIYDPAVLVEGDLLRNEVESRKDRINNTPKSGIRDVLVASLIVLVCALLISIAFYLNNSSRGVDEIQVEK